MNRSTGYNKNADTGDGFNGDDGSGFDSGDDDSGDGGNIDGGSHADNSGRSDGFGGSSGRFDDDENAAGGREDADRSYKPHAVDRGSSRLIAADLRDNKNG